MVLIYRHLEQSILLWPLGVQFKYFQEQGQPPATGTPATGTPATGTPKLEGGNEVYKAQVEISQFTLAALAIVHY